MANSTTGALVRYEETLTKQLARQFSKHKNAEIAWAAEKQYALAILRKNDYLTTCTPESFALAMLDVAFTGLSLNPVLGHAYLIPYKGELFFKPSYKGLAHLVFRAGTVKSIQTALVRSKDSFQVQTLNNRRTIHHVEHSADTDQVIAAYAILHYTNGGEYVEVMNRSELAACEAQAMSVPKGGAVWKGPWKGEMQRKAVLRRALKHVPLDDGGRMEQALKVADKYDPIEFEPAAEPEQPQVLLVSDQQALEAHALLTDNGLESGKASVWLMKMAGAMGYGAFQEIPVERFEEAKTRLLDRLKKLQGDAHA